MSEQQHTDGPWEAVELTPGGGTAVVRIGDIVVEGMYRGGENDTLTLADARLIAAAPELLAMLEEMTAIAEKVDGWASFPMEPIERAYAAIAKATGAMA